MPTLIVHVELADRLKQVFVPWLRDIIISLPDDAKINQTNVEKAFREQHEDLLKKHGLEKEGHWFAFYLVGVAKACEHADEITAFLMDTERFRIGNPLLFSEEGGKFKE